MSVGESSRYRVDYFRGETRFVKFRREEVAEPSVSAAPVRKIKSRVRIIEIAGFPGCGVKSILALRNEMTGET
jgi:hypothetical protein